MGGCGIYFGTQRPVMLEKLDNFDVLHYKAYSEDGVNGISVLTRAAEAIGTASAAQTYENKLYTQNARPSGILKVADKLEKECQGQNKGRSGTRYIAELTMLFGSRY